ncbi:hypothetical protein GGS26DRAFT_579443 [Hypomontagnella submonticulosa]|nr:hypothetical protein GGS26DRAFT_579443 [Hypomontagnella submonticulosa]
MSLSSLPNEMIHAILVRAVQVRSAKRALRLRLVSQSWSSMVLDAILDAGILEDPGLLIWLTCLWPQYLTHRIMRMGRQLPRPLLIIRQAAERVVAFRGEKASADALRGCVFEICSIPPYVNRGYQEYTEWLAVPQQEELEGLANGVPEDDEEFAQALLAAAAYAGEVALVRELLLTLRKAPYLICRQPGGFDPPILGYALDVAAFKGNVEVTRLLLEHIKWLGLEECGHAAVVQFASQGNQLGTLELGLDCRWHNWPSVSDIHSTTDVEIFKRLLDFGIEHYSSRTPRDDWRDCLFKNFSPGSFSLAARKGEIRLMEYLLQLGMPRDVWMDDLDPKYRSFVSEVAENGRYSTVLYLLGEGFAMGSRSIEAAARSGSYRIVKLLLTKNTNGTKGLGRALLQAVKRENEPVFRLLVEYGARMDEDIEQRALRFATDEGLESMVQLMREYGYHVSDDEPYFYVGDGELWSLPLGFSP